MPRYKVLKSVAHNLGHSFTSLMNYAIDDYVMGHILRFARQTGQDTLTINLITGEAGPPDLLQQPIADIPSREVEWFSRMVNSHGSDKSLVQSAKLTLRFDLAVKRPHATAPEFIESPYICEVLITDNRGKIHAARLDGWWFPERTETIKSDPRPWWKFWSPRNYKS